MTISLSPTPWTLVFILAAILLGIFGLMAKEGPALTSVFFRTSYKASASDRVVPFILYALTLGCVLAAIWTILK